MQYGTAMSLHHAREIFEGSKMAPSRDPRNANQWPKQINKIIDQNKALSGLLQRTARQVSQMRRKPLGGSIGGFEIATFQIVSDGGDWYNAYPFDGKNISGALTKVAKNQDLRCIPSTGPQAGTPPGGAWYKKVIRGVTYTYTYNAVAGTTLDGVNVVEYTRSVSGSDSSSATSYVTPCLNCLNDGSDPAGAGDIITAFQTTFSSPETLVGVIWQAFDDGRAWADK